VNITLTGTKIQQDNKTLAFEKNNLVDVINVTVDTNESWSYKLDIKYPQKCCTGEQLYNIIDMTRTGDVATVKLTAAMLPFSGKYTAQLRGIDGDKVYHSDTFDMWVKYSIEPGSTYDPVPSEFYQIEAKITDLNNHPPTPGNNGYWMIWNPITRKYEESPVALPEGTLPDISDATKGWYLTNDGEHVYWAQVQSGGDDVITAIQVNGIEQPIVDKVAQLTVSKATVGLNNVDNVRQYSANNPPPYPVTSVDGFTGDVTTLAVKYITQNLTGEQKQKARENIGAGTSDFDGDYNSLMNKPYIPTKTSELENDSGYITTDALQGYAKEDSIPTTVSQLENDAGYITVADAPVQSVNGQTGAVTITKGSIGLGNVDNTSDADKPVSTAQANAIAQVQENLDQLSSNLNDGTVVVAKATGDANGNNIANTYATKAELANITAVQIRNKDEVINATQATVQTVATQYMVDNYDRQPQNWDGLILTITDMGNDKILYIYSEVSSLWINAGINNVDLSQYVGVFSQQFTDEQKTQARVNIGAGTPYTLPMADATTLGGVKPVAKTDDMTGSVGVDENGQLWVKPGADISTIPADKVMFDSDLVFTYQFGKYTPTGGKVTVPADNKSLLDVLNDAYSEDKNPTVTQPIVSVSSTTAKAYEVGTSVTPQYSATFNAGRYEYGPNPTGAAITTWAASNNITADTRDTQTGTFPSYIVPDSSAYRITVRGTYSDGQVPITALEKPYPTGQIRGTTKSAQTGLITGYRNSFYGTLTDKTTTINSAAIRGLAQKSGKALANGNTFTVNIPVNAQVVLIAYPATLRDVTSIKDVNGLNADITSAFTKSAVNVEGAAGYTAISYKVYRLDFAKPNDTANKYTVII
jgi:hypothetical protein